MLNCSTTVVGCMMRGKKKKRRGTVTCPRLSNAPCALTISCEASDCGWPGRLSFSDQTAELAASSYSARTNVCERQRSENAVSAISVCITQSRALHTAMFGIRGRCRQTSTSCPVVNAHFSNARVTDTWRIDPLVKSHPVNDHLTFSELKHMTSVIPVGSCGERWLHQTLRCTTKHLAKSSQPLRFKHWWAGSRRTNVLSIATLCSHESAPRWVHNNTVATKKTRLSEQGIGMHR